MVNTVSYIIYAKHVELHCIHCSGYHQKCIDPWLTENRKLCPICKRKVAKGEDSDSSSDEGGSQPHPPPNSNENTPLVHASIQTSANSGSNQRTLLSVAQELNRGILACPGKKRHTYCNIVLCWMFLQYL